MPLFLPQGSRNWWPVACILLGQLWPSWFPAGVIISIWLTFCDTIYFSTENNQLLFIPSCWAYIQVTSHCGQKSCRRYAEDLSDCWKALFLLKNVTQSCLTPFREDQKFQNALHCIIFPFQKDKFSCSLGREVPVTTSHTLYTRRLNAGVNSKQTLRSYLCCSLSQALARADGSSRDCPNTNHSGSPPSQELAALENDQIARIS